MKGRAILLVNLGSPGAPDKKSVRSYLNEFLMDRYVIQLPWLLRRLIVSLFVLPRRPAASALAYRSIWWDEGSPLIVLSRRVQAALQLRLAGPVSIAMRYGQPGIESQLLDLASRPDVHEVLLIPMYPHHADSTITTSVSEAQRVMRKHNLDIELKIHVPFYNHPAYIRALIATSQPWLEKTFDHILFSYHGLPESHLHTADPTKSHCLLQPECCATKSPAHGTCYRHQVFETTRCFVSEAGLKDDQFTIAFQSRLGRSKWLSPSTTETIRDLAEKGVKRLLVICPSFVTDCLETLEEIGIRGRAEFLDAGGESLQLIPCLNDDQDWLDVLENWCRQSL